jgi:glycosyltransferase involved in cell wall biosynthesis
MKFALVSHALPPTWSGQAMVLRRLLEGLSGDRYCLISTEDYETGEGAKGYTRKLPGRYYRLPPEPRLNRGHRFGIKFLREALNAVPGVLLRARRIARILRREGCEAVVACTGGLLDLPSAYAASRMAGVPFYAYVFDYYAYQFVVAEEQFIARFFEPFLMKGARGVIVPNEILRDELRRRYGVESTVIHNPFEISDYEALPVAPTRSAGGEVRITYTGAVYEAHFDAFRNLVAAIESLNRPDVKLHLYTALQPSYLAGQGIRGPVVFHEHRAASEMPRIQREADVLFLPLAFKSPYPELVRTSAPGKLAEYLAARRPVLVHAPPRSFVSWYFRRHECGMVVDEPDVSKLARAIEEILGDDALRERLGERAWRQATTDFGVGKARAAFAGLLKLNGGDVSSPREESALQAGMRS